MTIKRGRYYRLNEDHIPIPCTLQEWAGLFESKERFVKHETVGAYFVSTVFLGIDHSFGEGPPLLFETMVVQGRWSECWQKRTATWELALEAHREAVARAREERFDDDE